MMESDNSNNRWLCSGCGDLDYLNTEDLCRSCAPEPVAEFAVVCCRALCGEPEKMERAWAIK